MCFRVFVDKTLLWGGASSQSNEHDKMEAVLAHQYWNGPQRRLSFAMASTSSRLEGVQCVYLAGFVY